MTMFKELYELATSAALTMVISADEKSGRMTINVVPKPKMDVDEPALTKALSLTATPDEFDAEFVGVLKGYREVRQSLVEQAEATQEVLQAAKAASAKKAGEAMTKAVKPAPQAAAPKAPVKAQTDTADDLGDDDAGAAGRAPQPSAATTADSASYDLFG
ncbi:MAG: PRTRC system protein E [Ferribacterium limneticum]|jgi:PRTRC genetic system protein E|uniref:ParB-related ThiF-related cassette protein E domain-containing protein n=1 Tax=Dechloromonas aromatica (strain RCB) TaxID=159087 RepID=Q47D07_DECAR|nr:PRTRC system protein E [Azonexus sp.]